MSDTLNTPFMNKFQWRVTCVTKQTEPYPIRYGTLAQFNAYVDELLPHVKWVAINPNIWYLLETENDEQAFMTMRVNGEIFILWVMQLTQKKTGANAPKILTNDSLGLNIKR